MKSFVNDFSVNSRNYDRKRVETGTRERVETGTKERVETGTRERVHNNTWLV